MVSFVRNHGRPSDKGETDFASPPPRANLGDERTRRFLGHLRRETSGGAPNVPAQRKKGLTTGEDWHVWFSH